MAKHTWTLTSTTLSGFLREAVNYLDKTYPDLPYEIKDRVKYKEIVVEEDESEKNLQALALIQIKNELHILWWGYMAGLQQGWTEKNANEKSSAPRLRLF